MPHNLWLQLQLRRFWTWFRSVPMFWQAEAVLVTCFAVTLLERWAVATLEVPTLLWSEQELTDQLVQASRLTGYTAAILAILEVLRRIGRHQADSRVRRESSS